MPIVFLVPFGVAVKKEGGRWTGPNVHATDRVFLCGKMQAKRRRWLLPAGLRIGSKMALSDRTLGGYPPMSENHLELATKQEVRLHIDRTLHKSPNPTDGEALYALGNVKAGVTHLYQEVLGRATRRTG